MQETAGIQSLLLSICLSIASHERGFEYKLKTVSQVFTPFLQSIAVLYLNTLFTLLHNMCICGRCTHIHARVCMCAITSWDKQGF